MVALKSEDVESEGAMKLSFHIPHAGCSAVVGTFSWKSMVSVSAFAQRSHCLKIGLAPAMAYSSDGMTADASTERVSHQFVAVGEVPVNIGTFNLGLMQNAIESKKFQTQTLPNFRRIVAKGFELGDLHQLNLCEVGGHRKVSRFPRDRVP